MIVGCYGFQRSGKTALAVFLARLLNVKHGMQIYTNLAADGMTLIERISDIPLDGKPKIVLLDEVNYILDSRSFKTNTEYTMFLNTLGKQKIILLVTAVHIGMVELRLRSQHNYVIFARDGGQSMEYMILDVQRSSQGFFSLPRSEDLWSILNYDTNNVIPNYVESDIEQFVKKAKEVKEGKKVQEELITTNNNSGNNSRLGMRSAAAWSEWTRAD